MHTPRQPVFRYSERGTLGVIEYGSRSGACASSDCKLLNMLLRSFYSARRVDVGVDSGHPAYDRRMRPVGKGVPTICSGSKNVHART